MSDHPEGRNGLVNPAVKYEPTDLSLRAVLIFSGGLVVVLILVSVGLWFLIPAFLGPTPQPAPFTSNEEGPWKDWKEVKETAPAVRDSRLPPPPELEAIDQTAPASEGGKTHTRPIGEQIEQEESHLKGYGWMDREKGTVYIPIEDAMKKLAGQQGEKP
jgi:hypothetical protein